MDVVHVYVTVARCGSLLPPGSTVRRAFVIYLVKQAVIVNKEVNKEQLYKFISARQQKKYFHLIRKRIYETF